MNNTQTISKILSGISKSLDIANKFLPIYSDAKPLFKNAHNIYNLFKNKSNDEKIQQTIIKHDQKKGTIKNISNNPQFFI